MLGIVRTVSRMSGGGAGNSEAPYLALHPMGFSVPPGLRPGAVGSYSTFSPLPRSLQALNSGGA